MPEPTSYVTRAFYQGPRAKVRKLCQLLGLDDRWTRLGKRRTLTLQVFETEKITHAQWDRAVGVVME